MAKLGGIVEVEAPKPRTQLTKGAKEADGMAIEIISNPGKVFMIECSGTNPQADDYESDRSVKVRLFHAIVNRGGISNKRFKSWTDPNTDRKVYIKVEVVSEEADEAEASANGDAPVAAGKSK